MAEWEEPSTWNYTWLHYLSLAFPVGELYSTIFSSPAPTVKQSWSWHLLWSKIVCETRELHGSILYPLSQVKQGLLSGVQNGYEAEP